MSQGSYQFDSNGVRFSKKLTIEMVSQFVTQFLHYRDARDAYLTHEAVLQYLQSESQNNNSDRPSDKEKKTKTAIQAIGEKMSLAVKNMPSETSPMTLSHSFPLFVGTLRSPLFSWIRSLS